MRTILVTGASGFIGFNMVQEIIKRGDKVYAMILKDDKIGERKLKKTSEKIRIITDNVEDMILKINEYPRFDLIVHFASVGVNPSYTDIATMIDTNVKMGCLLVDFAKKNNSRLMINVGSCFEYGKNSGAPLKESDECKPESFYALTKNISVKLTNEYAIKKGINLVTVRPFGVFGRGENSYRLAPSIIRHGIEKKDLDLTAGEQIRDFVDVKDVVNVIYELSISDKLDNYNIYNICSDNPVCVKDFALEIINLLKFDVSKFHFGNIPYRENESMVFVGDNTKLKKTINYKFKTDHTDGIMDLYNQIKDE